MIIMDLNIDIHVYINI